MVNNWQNIIQDYLLPPTCILCGNAGIHSQDICQACFYELPRNNFCCYRCAEIFETPPPIPKMCGHCLTQSPAFDETHAPFLYQHTIRYLITQLKFNRHYKNARVLGYLLAEHLFKTTEIPELIIPIPLHPKRYQQRGFNQTVEIAKTISKQLQIPMDSKNCIRIKNTAHQADLPAKQRHKNIKNAFSMVQPIKAQHVAILDDVMTTGATTHELATVLKKSGVARVDVWACSRA